MNACTINVIVVTDFKSSNCAQDQSWNLLYTCDLGEESVRGECSDYMCNRLNTSSATGMHF